MAGGGVGEAALIGAVIGGGSAAVTGGDPLKGALMGGLTSGVMGGMGGLEGVDKLTAGTDAFTATQAGNPEAYSSAMNTLATAPTEAGGLTPYTQALGSSTQTTAANLGGYWDNPANWVDSAKPVLSPETANALSAGPGSTSAQLRGLDLVKANPMTFGGIGVSQALPGLLKPKGLETAGAEKYTGPLSRFRYDPSSYQPDVVTPPSPAYRPVYAADGGLMDGGNQGIAGLSANPSYPMAQQQNSRYAVPSQMPVGATDVRMAHMTPTPMARGGIADLGGYSDGGRMLKGPGDGMSDSIPASISGKQPARLADGEFVVPADVVSHLGNGSTDAGAKQLYSMMDKVRKARTGRKAQGKQINPNKYVPA